MQRNYSIRLELDDRDINFIYFPCVQMNTKYDYLELFPVHQVKKAYHEIYSNGIKYIISTDTEYVLKTDIDPNVILDFIQTDLWNIKGLVSKNQILHIPAYQSLVDIISRNKYIKKFCDFPFTVRSYGMNTYEFALMNNNAVYCILQLHKIS